MYIKYAWNTAQTDAGLLADLSALICGTASFAGLSAGCDQVNSAFVASTVSTNWQVFDAAASATSRVYRSLNTDGVGYKYMQLGVTTTAVIVTAWESWNAGTHAGTNQSASLSSLRTSASALGGINPAPFTVAFPTTGIIYLLVTSRFCLLMPAPAVTTLTVGVVEFAADTGAIAATYPLHALVQLDGVGAYFGTSSTAATTKGFALCRIKNPTLAGDLVGTAITQTAGLFGINSVPVVATTLGPAGTFVVCVDMLLTSFHSTTNAAVLGRVLGGLKYAQNALPAYSSLDELIAGSTTYVLLKSANGAVAVPKG